MERIKALTSQQLVIGAAGSLVVASVLLLHGNKIGFLILSLATVCAVGAFAKYKSR